MRLPRQLLAGIVLPLAAAGALAGPAAPARAAAPPCVDLTVVTVNCPVPGSPSGPTGPAAGCVGADVVPGAVTLVGARNATLCLLNAERRQRGLRPFKQQRSLTAVAKRYAVRMAAQDFFEHTAPDGSTFLGRIRRTSYLKGRLSRWSVGENIAWGTFELATPKEIVEAWMASPGHRRNILDKRFHEVGLAVVVGAPQPGVADAGAATYVNEFGQRRR